MMEIPENSNLDPLAGHLPTLNNPTFLPFVIDVERRVSASILVVANLDSSILVWHECQACR